MKSIESLNKKVEKMTRLEKRRVYSGDLSNLYSKMGILRQEDQTLARTEMERAERELLKTGKKLNS